jgi:hypothetical protein
MHVPSIIRRLQNYNKKISIYKVDAWLGGPIWVSRKPILPYGCHCNAHVTL